MENGNEIIFQLTIADAIATGQDKHPDMEPELVESLIRKNISKIKNGLSSGLIWDEVLCYCFEEIVK
ncbi:hypothetical protein ACFC9N_11375 [Enterococcus casseliflavus]|uniref:hypothetical protein n=1 Tax=Enterococcus TaxID=1350 RepID=UPI000A369FC9|nr:hypothetical protein [Enterococcus sp. 4E1_DIV0656]OTO09286.1 hypothetical protein A5882_003619 [Enterococcus sp. 4E1_DIV0656]